MARPSQPGWVNLLGRNGVVPGVFAVLVASTSSPGIVHAAPWYMEPYVDAGIGYNDNPELASDEDIAAGTAPGSQWYGTLGGHLELGTETPSTRTALILEALARRYQDDDSLDSEYLLAAVDLDKTGQNSDFALQLGASEDATLETELLDTGRFEENVSRRSLYVRPSITHRFSERWGGELGLGLEQVEFDDNDEELIDYDEKSANARVSYLVTQRTTATLDLVYINFQPSAAPGVGDVIEDESFQVLFGAEHRLTERSRFTWSLGPDYRDTTFADIGMVSDQDMAYTIGYSFDDFPNVTSLEIYSLEESSADGSLARVQGVSLDFSRGISALTTIGLGVVLEQRDPVRGELEEREYLEINPRLEWALSRNLSTRLNLFYREQELSATSLAPAESTDQSGALLELRYTWDRRTIP